MNFLHGVYKKSLEDNERNLNFWQSYINDLNALDFSLFSGKLTVPVLVPIGNKILFRGLLKHTNEVTVSLGADYFAKCSIKQAEIIKQHRIKDAQTKLELHIKEKSFLENQLQLNKSTHDTLGQEIIETCSEEEDKLWRERHRERVKLYNQNKEKNIDNCKNEITDEELWNRLEELELQEELEEEYLSMTNREREDDLEYLHTTKYDILETNQSSEIANQSSETVHMNNNSESKVHLLEQILTRQRNLELKLTEFQNKERKNCNTENDLLAKLNEMDELDELEDEMNRLDDILNDDSQDSESTTEEISTPSSKKSVTFADDDECETLEITFKHSNIEPDTSLYNGTNGIVKPSNIYEAFSSNLVNKTTTILKKSKYDHNLLKHPVENNYIEPAPIGKKTPRETIIVKDILEKSDENKQFNNQTRPVSLFKKKRQQQKT